jgi:lysosomal acid lipase/cholesteryl ester hydrolase
MREIPLFTLEGVRDAEVSTHWFHTEDGLGLSLLRFQRGAAEDAVLITHGLTTSTDMFIMPEHDNLVTHLLDQGYGDVWCLDTRLSSRHPYNLFKHRWTLDDVALYDFPPALATMREEIGDRPVHVIAHCLGATAFAMSLSAGLVEVTCAALNSVALTPRVPRWSRMKLAVAPAVIDHVVGTPYLNPSWSEDPGLTRGELISRAVSFERAVPGRHELHVFPGYGHQDPFMGQHVAREIFPRIIRFLDAHRDGRGHRRPRASARAPQQGVAK